MLTTNLNGSIKKNSKHFNQNDWASAYCNVEKELTDIQMKVVKGEVPKELSGCFYRNGPGLLEREGHWVHHPFDGDGMIAARDFLMGKLILAIVLLQLKLGRLRKKPTDFFIEVSLALKSQVD